MALVAEMIGQVWAGLECLNGPDEDSPESW